MKGELSGKKISVDGYNFLYQFITSIRTKEGFLLTTEEGKVVSHLKGMLSRLSTMKENGIDPIIIFDGEPHPLKKGTLELRRKRKEMAQKEWEEALEKGDLSKAKSKAQQTSRLTHEMVSDARRLLDLMGIQYIDAPGEGEAQAAFMCEKGMVYAAGSQDYDSLLFGSIRLLRNMGTTGKRKLPGGEGWRSVEPELIDLEISLDTLKITRKQLVDVAILVGTDFNEGVNGIGPKKALKLIRKYKDLETTVKQERLPLVEWDEVRKIFLFPDIKKDVKVEVRYPKEEPLREFLTEELGLNKNGVERNIERLNKVRSVKSQRSLDSFY